MKPVSIESLEVSTRIPKLMEMIKTKFPESKLAQRRYYSFDLTVTEPIVFLEFQYVNPYFDLEIAFGQGDFQGSPYTLMEIAISNIYSRNSLPGQDPQACYIRDQYSGTWEDNNKPTDSIRFEYIAKQAYGLFDTLQIHSELVI